LARVLFSVVITRQSNQPNNPIIRVMNSWVSGQCSHVLPSLHCILKCVMLTTRYREMCLYLLRCILKFVYAYYAVSWHLFTLTTLYLGICLRLLFCILAFVYVYYAVSWHLFTLTILYLGICLRLLRCILAFVYAYYAVSWHLFTLTTVSWHFVYVYYAVSRNNAVK